MGSDGTQWLYARVPQASVSVTTSRTPCAVVASARTTSRSRPALPAATLPRTCADTTGRPRLSVAGQPALAAAGVSRTCPGGSRTVSRRVASLSRRRSVPLKHHVSSSVRRGEGGVALLEFLSQDRGLGAAATLSACRRVLFGGNVTGFCPGGKGRCSLDHRRLLVLIIHKTL